MKQSKVNYSSLSKDTKPLFNVNRVIILSGVAVAIKVIFVIITLIK